MVTKAKVGIEARVENDGTHLDLDFPNGEKRTFHLPATHSLYDMFAAHGFGKKIRDQIAATKTPEEAVALVDTLLTAFGEGKWNAMRNAGSSPTVGILAQALSRLYGKSLEDAQAFVSKLTKKQQFDMRKEANVAAMIAEITAESGEVGEGVTDLLSGFAGDAPQEVKETEEAGN
jgi:hypothetical protein